jgi:FxLD family lantipeptide
MTANVMSQQIAQVPADGFELDVTLLEIADPAGLVNITNDNCGSTCGACTTGVA